jgi:hypothetical protein
VFGLSTGATFALIAVLLYFVHRRWLWVLIALFDALVIVIYFAAAALRDPPFEAWGLSIRQVGHREEEDHLEERSARSTIGVDRADRARRRGRGPARCAHSGEARRRHRSGMMRRRGVRQPTQLAFHRARLEETVRADDLRARVR